MNEVKRYEKMENEGKYIGMLYENKKTLFKPAYILIFEDKEKSEIFRYNIVGFKARQIEEIKDTVLNQKVEISLEKRYSEKYHKEYSVISSITVIRPKEVKEVKEKKQKLIVNYKDE